jgi:hypothetical protein
MNRTQRKFTIVYPRERVGSITLIGYEKAPGTILHSVWLDAGMSRLSLIVGSASGLIFRI